MSDFKKLVDQVASGKRMDEVSPPGFKGTVKAMKKRHGDEIDNPYALAWWMKNKGYKSSKKATGGPKNEANVAEFWDMDEIKNGSEKYKKEHGPGQISDMDASGIAQRTWGPGAFRDIKKHGSGWMVLVGPNDPIGFIQHNGSPLHYNRETRAWAESMGDPASIDGGQNAVFTGPDTGLNPEEIQRLEMGEDGTGAPYNVNVAADPTDTNTYVESIRVEHPQKGMGRVLEINESDIVVEWDNLQLSILGPERVPFSEAKYLFRVDERYSSDITDAEIDGHKKKKHKKHKKVREGGLAAAAVPEQTGELSASVGHSGSDWNPSLQADPDDSPDVTDFKAPESESENGLRSVVDDGVRDDMRGKAHSGDSRKGTREKIHTTEGKVTMSTKKEQLDEHMIAIQGTYRGKPSGFDDIPALDLTMDDLLEYDVPDPQDSVLTKGDQAPNEKIRPLSSEAGASAAHDSPYPDGDMADDKPADAPDTPDYDKVEDGGNEREANSETNPSADLSGSSKQNKSSETYDFNSDSDDDSNEEEKDEMDESILSWEDIGLQIDEECGCDGQSGYDIGMYDDEPSMTNEAEGGAAGVAMSRDLLDRLLKDVRDQQPDDAKLGYICSGIEAAASEKGSELGVEDIAMIMGEIKEAFSGQDVDNDGDAAPVDNAPEQQDDEYASDEEDAPTSVGFEDKAEGDGEEAGPEGGEEHEGKTKLMDKDDVDETVGASGSTGPTGGFGNEKNDKAIKPVSQNTTKGSGPGGSNSDNYGQDGSIPAVPKGSQRGTPGAPLTPEGSGKTVDPISESEQIDEAMVAVGMAAIGGVMRSTGDGPEIDPADPDAELKMIRRRAGLAEWWKV